MRAQRYTFPADYVSLTHVYSCDTNAATELSFLRLRLRREHILLSVVCTSERMHFCAQAVVAVRTGRMQVQFGGTGEFFHMKATLEHHRVSPALATALDGLNLLRQGDNDGWPYLAKLVFTGTLLTAQLEAHPWAATGAFVKAPRYHSFHCIMPLPQAIDRFTKSLKPFMHSSVQV